MSEAGVHRPHVAGIHGRDSEGAYSIVLSGGYEDDHVSLSAVNCCHLVLCFLRECFVASENLSEYDAIIT